MRVLRFVPAFLLFFLLGGQVLLLPDQANAWCCGCGSCWSFMGCDCPGYGGCAWCRAGDSESLQSTASNDKGTVDLRAVPEPLLSTVTNSDVTERLMGLRRGGCIRGNISPKLLGNAREGLKFEPLRFDEKNLQDQTLAFQMDADNEK